MKSTHLKFEMKYTLEIWNEKFEIKFWIEKHMI